MVGCCVSAVTVRRCVAATVWFMLKPDRTWWEGWLPAAVSVLESKPVRDPWRWFSPHLIIHEPFTPDLVETAVSVLEKGPRSPGLVTLVTEVLRSARQCVTSEHVTRLVSIKDQRVSNKLLGCNWLVGLLTREAACELASKGVGVKTRLLNQLADRKIPFLPAEAMLDLLAGEGLSDRARQGWWEKLGSTEKWGSVTAQIGCFSDRDLWVLAGRTWVADLANRPSVFWSAVRQIRDRMRSVRDQELQARVHMKLDKAVATGDWVENPFPAAWVGDLPGSVLSSETLDIGPGNVLVMYNMYAGSDRSVTEHMVDPANWWLWIKACMEHTSAGCSIRYCSRELSVRKQVIADIGERFPRLFRSFVSVLEAYETVGFGWFSAVPYEVLRERTSPEFRLRFCWRVNEMLADGTVNSFREWASWQFAHAYSPDHSIRTVMLGGSWSEQLAALTLDSVLSDRELKVFMTALVSEIGGVYPSDGGPFQQVGVGLGYVPPGVLRYVLRTGDSFLASRLIPSDIRKKQSGPVTELEFLALTDTVNFPSQAYPPDSGPSSAEEAFLVLLAEEPLVTVAVKYPVRVFSWLTSHGFPVDTFWELVSDNPDLRLGDLPWCPTASGN